MSNVIIIAEVSEKNGWANIVTNEDVEISVMLEKCPKLKEQLKDAKPGTEITGKLVEKNGKKYLWDIEDKKSGGGSKPFTPADKSFQAAQVAAQAAASLLALSKDPSKESFDAWFEHIHAKISSKITR